MGRMTPAQALAPTWVVYLLRAERDEVLYVGMTGNLQGRMHGHARQGYWSSVHHLDVEYYPNQLDAGRRESDLIFELDPPLNSAGRRTHEGERGVMGSHGLVTSCPDCTAMGLLWCGDDLIDAQWVGKGGMAFGNAGWFHRCAAREKSNWMSAR